MGGIKKRVKGSYKATIDMLSRCTKRNKFSALESVGEAGVEALASATPVRTGTTAASWNYELKRTRRDASVTFTNSNVVNGPQNTYNVAVLIQTGHGTGTGGWVPGHDYINPALQPVFDEAADIVWKEVTG